MPGILVFDVLETLLCLDGLKPLFRRVFRDEAVLREWYSQSLFFSQTLSLAGPYMPFGELGGGVLRMLGDAHGRKIKEFDLEELRTETARLAPHKEVPDALHRLKTAGFRLVALTNSTREVLYEQLRHDRLDGLFEAGFSVDDVRAYKPAAAAYHQVAERLNVVPMELRLVAAHTWDTIGALRASLAAALITRGNVRPLPVAPQPDIVGPDLASVAEEIIRRGPNPGRSQ